MIAPPGAGKGTQGARTAEHHGVPHIATGDLLRDHVARGTELGRSVQGHLDRGELVPDDVVLEMVRAAFEALPTPGYVLDGVPRTLPQARALYAIAKELDLVADVALHLHVERDELVRRLLARAAEQGRADDTAEVVADRLALYDDVTHPLLDWYDGRGILVTVDGMLPPEEVAEHIEAALGRIRQTQDGRQADLSGIAAAYGAELPT